MNVRSLFHKIIAELIPAPTLRRLSYIKKIILNPRQYALTFAERIARRVLSPPAYARAKSWARVKLTNKSPLVGSPQNLAPSAARQALVTPIYFRGNCYESSAELLAVHGNLQIDCVVVCAFLGRYEVLDMMVAEATALPRGYSNMVCLVGSSQADGEYLQKLTEKNPLVMGTLTDNSPVGRKWQHAVDVAREITDFGLLAITGSDDIIPVGTLTAIIDRHRMCTSDESIAPFATSLYGTMEWLILSVNETDIISPQLVKCNYRLGLALMPLGAGRFYSRQFIDQFDGDIFEISQSRHLDDKGFYKVRDGGFGVEYFNVKQGVILSVKGNWPQMNSFDDILNASNCEVSEFSFEGFALLKKQMTQSGFERLFGLSEGKQPDRHSSSI
jgi:hypothetical protein